MDTIRKLSDYSLLNGSKIRFMGVPKTIDNDLASTDHTPGYGSAAKYIGSITKEVIRDGLVYDQQSVTILEIMGRNAGWLTGAAALAKCEDCEGPDLIFLPEVTFDVDAFVQKPHRAVETKSGVVCHGNRKLAGNGPDTGLSGGWGRSGPPVGADASGI